MVVIGLVLTFLLTCVITGFMLYVAMVTGIGPWIAPVIGVMMQGISNCFAHDTIKRLGLIVTVSSSVGGIIGTAFGFSFPTWFFIDKESFYNALNNKPLFLLIIASLVLIAGIIGIISASFFYKDLIQKEELPFPVGAMTHSSVINHNIRERRYLYSGIMTYCSYMLFFVKRLWGSYALPLTHILYKGFSCAYITIPTIACDFSVIPLLLSIGFVAGSIMAIPLACGVLLKMTCVTWLHKLYPSLSDANFLFALCSGIVVSGTLGSFVQQAYAALKGGYSLVSNHTLSYHTLYELYERYKIFLPVLILSIGYFYWYSFSLTGSLYLFMGALICAYQLSYVAGKIGLAPLGRFATFVMVPGMLVFGWNPLQITLVATFVELVGGITVDNLQGKKALQLSGITPRYYVIYQYVALCAASCAVAFFFYYFINHYELGTSVLSAQRAQARALLLQVATVDIWVLLWGVIIGLILKQLSCNPVLVLTGLLMDFSLLLPLIVGGLAALYSKNSKQYEPFFSGIYVANACGSIVNMFL